MVRIATAFVWVLILSFLAGLPVGKLLEMMGYDFWTGPIIVVSFAIIEGWIKARGLLSRRLGHRDESRLIRSDRAVTVGAFEFSLPGAKKTVDVPDSFYILTPSKEEISYQEIREFVWRATVRQASGKPGISRKYWTREHKPRWSREWYEAMVSELDKSGLIEGRIGGRSGRLNKSYDEIMLTLRGE